MTSKPKTVLSLVVALALFSTAGAAQGAASPKQRTLGLIEAFKAVKKAEGKDVLTEEDRRSNVAAFEKLDEFFDYDRMVNDPIEPHKAKFTPAQLERYRPMFKQLIRTIAYPDAGSFFRKATYTLVETMPDGPNGDRGDVQMEARVPDKDVDTVITFHWVRDKGQFLLYDVSFDGGSLTKDYQNQFGRIISKEGVDGLLARLDKRLHEEREKYGVNK